MLPRTLLHVPPHTPAPSQSDATGQLQMGIIFIRSLAGILHFFDRAHFAPGSMGGNL